MNLLDLAGAFVAVVCSASAALSYTFSSIHRKTYFPLAPDMRLIHAAVAVVMGTTAWHWGWLSVHPEASNHMDRLGLARWSAIALLLARSTFGLWRLCQPATTWEKVRDSGYVRIRALVRRAKV